MCSVVGLYTVCMNIFYAKAPDGGYIGGNICTLMKNEFCRCLICGRQSSSASFVLFLFKVCPVVAPSASQMSVRPKSCLPDFFFIYVRWWYTFVMYMTTSVSFPTSSFSWNFLSPHELNFRSLYLNNVSVSGFSPTCDYQCGQYRIFKCLIKSPSGVCAFVYRLRDH
jgi:hypothetical protein